MSTGCESQLTVVNIAGDSLEFDAEDFCFVSDLKSRIEEAWQVPPMFQKLIAGAEILEDSSELASSYNFVTMLVSVDVLAEVPERCRLLNVHARVTPEMMDMDQQAVKSIEVLQTLDAVMVHALRGSRSALSIIDACLSHSDTGVRRVAWHVLDQRWPQISHCDIMASITTLLAYHGAGGRCLGAVMFGKILKDEGAHFSMEQALDELEDLENDALAHVAPALTELNVSRITKVVAAFLEDPSPDVSCSMLEVLPNLFQKNALDEHGRHHIIKRLLVLVDDSNATTKFKCTFLSALPDMVAHGFGNADGKAIVLRSLKDQESSIRLAAVRAAPFLEVDDLFLSEFLPTLHDNQVSIRSYAVQTLLSFSQNEYYRYEQILGALLPCLEDVNAMVRYEVSQALGVIATQGDSDVISFLLLRLKHSNPGVRRSAVDAISAVSEGDAHSITGLRALQNDPDASVRYGVELALNLIEEEKVRERLL